MIVDEITSTVPQSSPEIALQTKKYKSIENSKRKIYIPKKRQQINDEFRMM